MNRTDFINNSIVIDIETISTNRCISGNKVLKTVEVLDNMINKDYVTISCLKLTPDNNNNNDLYILNDNIFLVFSSSIELTRKVMRNKVLLITYDFSRSCWVILDIIDKKYVKKDNEVQLSVGSDFKDVFVVITFIVGLGLIGLLIFLVTHYINNLY
jgi:hypothetical protein